MAQDLELALRIRADIQQAAKEIRGVREELRRFGAGGKGAQNDVRGLNQELDHSTRKMRGLGDVTRSVRGLLAGLGAAISFRQIIQNTVRQEQALAQVEQRLKSTGGAAGFTRDQLAQMAGELQNVTTFGDEAILEMQSLLLTFTNVKGDVFREATVAALDMSQALGQDLKSSAIQLGKALNDPIEGVSALQRVGVSLTDDQKKLVEQFVRTGDIASAQRVILKELAVEFGGAAHAARDTFGGALQGLSNAFGDLLEAKGGLPEAREQIKQLTALLQDPATVEGIDTLTNGIVRFGGWLVEAAVDFGRFGQLLGREAARMAGNLAPLDQIEEDIKDIDNALKNSFLFKPTKYLFTSKEELERIREQLIAERDALLAAQGGAAPSAPGGGPAPTPSPPPPTGPSEEFQKAQADLERRIAMLGRESAEQQMLWEVERGRYKDLAQGEKDALVAMARRFDAGTEAIRQAEEQARTAEEAKRKQEAYDAELDRAAQALRDTIDPMEPLRRELAKIQLLLDQGKISWDEWAEGSIRVQERMDELNDKLDETGDKSKGSADDMSQYWIQGARNMQSAMADFLFDPFDKGLKGMLRGFVDVVRRMVSEALAAQLLKALLGDMGSTGEVGGWVKGGLDLLAGVFHSGGVVGAGSAARLVSPFAFLNAPRYHSGGIAGLAPDEVPAILRKNEEVLTEDNPRHIANGGGAGAQSLRMILVDDRANIGDYMKSAEGERVLVESVKRNSMAIRQVLGG